MTDSTRSRAVPKGAPDGSSVQASNPRLQSTLPDATHAFNRGFLLSNPAAIVDGVTQQPQRHVDDGFPPLPGPDASDDERGRVVMARFVARHGAPPLEDYRRVYAGAGAEWPGDDEIRRRHPVAPDIAG